MAKSVTLCGGGYTERDIAAKLRCSKTAVCNIIVKFTAHFMTGRGLVVRLCNGKTVQ